MFTPLNRFFGGDALIPDDGAGLFGAVSSSLRSAVRQWSRLTLGLT